MRIEHPLLTALLWAAVLIGPASMATAQPSDAAEASEAQTELNNEGVGAVNDGEYDKAIKLFKASLELGELNITWLNLGRAFQKAGRCAEAIDAYARTLKAPEVEEPGLDAIRNAVEKFRSQLAVTCPGEVRLTCSPQSLEISVDGAPPTPCPAELIPLDPGEHTIEATLGEQRTSKTVKVVALETLDVSLTLKPVAKTESDKDKDKERDKDRDKDKQPIIKDTSLLLISGSLTGATGAAALIVGGLFDIAIQGNIRDLKDLQSDPTRAAEFEKLKAETKERQELNSVLLIGGGSLLAIGGTLLIIEALYYSDEQPQEGGVLVPWVAPDAAGVWWTATW